METTVVYWGIQLVFYLGDTMVPNNGESNGKEKWKIKWKLGLYRLWNKRRPQNYSC